MSQAWKKSVSSTPKKSVLSALILMPPKHLWSQIQDIRRKYDRAYSRWMPHINLLYPFVDEPSDGFGVEVEKIKDVLKKSKIRPFEVEFTKDSFGFFPLYPRSIVWLKPILIPEKPTPSECNQEAALEAVKIVKKLAFQPVKVEDSISSKSNQTPKLAVTMGIVEPKIDRNPYCSVSSPHTGGISSLKDAIWKDEDLIKERTMHRNIQPGLDSLRFAVWTEADNKKVRTCETQNQKYQKQKSKSNSMCSNYSHNKYKSSLEEQIDGNVYVCEGISMTEEDDNTNADWKTISKNVKAPRKEKNITEEKKSVQKETKLQRDNVIHLQKLLFETFPFCDELQNKSSKGFTPHLTLGQCPPESDSVDNFISDLKSKWVDMMFTVDSVYIISRLAGKTFVIKEKIAFDNS